MKTVIRRNSSPRVFFNAYIWFVVVDHSKANSSVCKVRGKNRGAFVPPSYPNQVTVYEQSIRIIKLNVHLYKSHTDDRLAHSKTISWTFSSKRLLSIMPLVLYRLLLHTGWKTAIKIHSGNIIIAKFLFLCFSCLINYGIFCWMEWELLWSLQPFYVYPKFGSVKVTQWRHAGIDRSVTVVHF